MNPTVLMSTTRGSLALELFEQRAPGSVANFLNYVDDHYYDGTVFHRVIPGFMIQGGGYEPGMRQKKTRGPITNESENGLSNVRGTISMARTSDPHSATAQFFINLVDNVFLDSNRNRGTFGYTVFGNILGEMGALDLIGQEPTHSYAGHQDVPVQDVLIQKVSRVHFDMQWLLWNDGTVRKIAQAIRSADRMADLPVLADALEDAGCDDADLLAHCRGPGPHVRGCWVVDLLLGKS